MKKYMRITSTLLFLMAFISSVANGAQLSSQPFDSFYPGNPLAPQIDKYIGNKFTADFIFKGKLLKQMDSILTMGETKKTLGEDIYLLTWFRYQEASSQGALIVDRQSHILLAAIAHGWAPNTQPYLEVFVRDRKNLKYLPVLKKWVDGEPEYYKNYQTNLYDLNCKSVDIMKCKITESYSK